MAMSCDVRNMRWENGDGRLTVHGLLVDIIDAVIPVDYELILLLWLLDLSDLVVRSDEVSEL
jgi:hypothetical protein